MDSIDHIVEFRLTKDGKLPNSIPCIKCFTDMRRYITRNGAVYKCVECGAQTTLDPEELKRLKLS
jgi:hypothetical protein